jgi:hypothetical protein
MSYDLCFLILCLFLLEKMFSLTEVQDVCVHISDIFMIGPWSSYTGPCHYPHNILSMHKHVQGQTPFLPLPFS